MSQPAFTPEFLREGAPTPRPFPHPKPMPTLPVRTPAPRPVAQAPEPKPAVPTVDAPVTPERVEADLAVILELPMIRREGDRILVTTKYFSPAVAFYRSLPDRVWVGETRSWSLPLECACALRANIDLIRKAGDPNEQPAPPPPPVESPPALAAREKGRRMVKDHWWLFPKKALALVEDIVEREDVLSRAQVALVEALMAQAHDRHERIKTDIRENGLGRVTEFPQEIVHAIREGLDILAGKDPDRAQLRNNVGFSAPDSAVGHHLASLDDWGPAEAYTGWHMLRKYRRQIGAELHEQIYG